jgi:hypothetical protein
VALELKATQIQRLKEATDEEVGAALGALDER